MRLARFLAAVMTVLSTAALLTILTQVVQAAPNGGVVGNGNPSSCNDTALNAALAGGGMVTFNCGGPATLTVTTTKVIAANTTIDGNNNGQALTLTAASGIQLFNVSSGQGLTLTNLHIFNVSYTPAIINYGKLLISATQFISNAGIIYGYGPSTVLNARFVDNTNYVLFSNTAITVTGSQFVGNSYGGALVEAFDAITVDGSDFISNTAGGLVRIDQTNNALQVSNSHFYWNKGPGYGSVLFLYGGPYGNTPGFTLTNSALLSNTATAGGAIYDNNATAYISNTLFISNTSNNSSGVLYLDYPGPLQLLSSTFQFNTGGAIYANGASKPLLIADSQFFSNTSTYSAGGISVGPVTVTHSSFINNVANTVGNPHAGALESTGQAYITGSTFLNNVGSYGGAMSLSSAGFGPYHDVVVNTLIKGNVSTANGGGGIRATQYLTLTDSQIVNNIAAGDNTGGGLSFAGYTLQAARNLFQNNSVTGTNGTGGGLYVSGSASSIADSTIVGNSAGGSGGGIYLNYFSNDGPATITHTTIQSNTASAASSSASGGGIYATAGWGSINLSLFEVALNSNRALGSAGGTGGGLYFSGGVDAGVLSISRSLISNNAITATSGQGGGLYLNGGAAITNSTFYSNSAASGSGTYFAGTGVTLTLASVTVMSNTTTTGVITNQLNNAGADYRFRLIDTIVGGGSSGNCLGSKVLSLGHNLSSDATCNLTGTLDLANTNPQLGPLADNGGFTYSFLPTAYSPAINAGDPANCPGDDQRGVARPIGSACDIGAIESPYTLTPQTITFAALPDKLVSDPPFIITATASSGLPVAFNSSGVCHVNSSTVTLNGIVGTCTITATQSGDAIYAAALPVLRSFNVTGQMSQTITFNPIPNHFINNSPFTVAPTATSGLSVTVTSLTTSVCTVNNYLVALADAGTCTLRAAQPGNATYAAAPDVDRSFEVVKWKTYLPLIIR